MAKTAFSGTEIKKINIGTTQIKKVSVGSTLVYTSAEPFYIVDNAVCKQQLHWTLTESSNLVPNQAKSITWTVGQVGAQVNGWGYDDTKPTSCTWVSDAIDTKGNSTLYYSAYVQTNGAYNNLIVNGKSYSGGGGFPTTGTAIDISGLSSITLTVKVHAWEYNPLYWEPNILRFY